MAYQIIKKPDLTTKAKTGMCLWYAQEAYGVAHIYGSAWEAWQATKYKHPKNVPNGALVWFSHYGTYGNPPTYGNWGHVVIKWGNKYYSAPVSGYGYGVYTSVAQVEKAFNSKFVGWSEDISGVRVIKEEVEMVTLDQQEVLYRFFVGKAVSSIGKANVGKKTFAQEEARLKASKTYQAKIAQAKAGKLDIIAHLPKALRQNIK